MDKIKNMDRLDAAFIKACREALLQDQAFIAGYCTEHAQAVSDSLYAALEEGIHALHSFKEDGLKGSLAYLQFSFLLSGIFSGEHLLKIDFYDDRFYADPFEIDCFWDYRFLLPYQQQRLEKIISDVRNEVVRVLDCDICERFPAYRLGQMQLLQEVVKCIQHDERISFLLLSEADPEIKVIYGVYMGDAQRLFTIKKEQP